MKIACNQCGEECKVEKYDDSFAYAGTHCSHGQPGTHFEYHHGSDCCDAQFEEMEFFICKCGHEQEIHPDYINETQCLACKMYRCWAG